MKKLIHLLLVVAFTVAALVRPVRATVDDALSFALESVDKHVKDGYTLREDTWGGDLPAGEAKAITHQLFKGNDYWFCMGTDVKGAKISVHIYDGDGALVEDAGQAKQEVVKDGAFASTFIKCKKTGTYFLIVKVESSGEDRTSWGLVYAYK